MEYGDIKIKFDKKIIEIYTAKETQLLNKKEWIDDNKKSIEKNRDKLEKAVKSGKIKDTSLDTIWKYNHEYINNKIRNYDKIKSDIGANYKYYFEKINEKYQHFISNWELPQCTIIFTILDNTDFYFKNKIIYIDFDCLLNSKNWKAFLIEGLIHELFHVWMRNEPTHKALEKLGFKEKIFNKAFEEGLAVFISGQDFPDFYYRRNKNYKEIVKNSFMLFDRFIISSNNEELRSLATEGFKNMGFMYVVGYEISITLYKHYSNYYFINNIESFRKNPKIIYNDYLSISNKAL